MTQLFAAIFADMALLKMQQFFPLNVIGFVINHDLDTISERFSPQYKNYSYLFVRNFFLLCSSGNKILTAYILLSLECVEAFFSLIEISILSFSLAQFFVRHRSIVLSHEKKSRFQLIKMVQDYVYVVPFFFIGWLSY